MTDRIRTLVKRISETRPVQSARRDALLQELRALRDDLDAEAVPHQAHSLDAAILLLEFMNRSDDVATADTLQIVASLVGTIDESALRRHPGRPQLRKLPNASHDVAEHGDLRMTQEFLLGSILLQAGVISPESLARALQLHASSHLAVGQCLVQLGAATPEQIASAIHYQDRLREDVRSVRTEPAHPAQSPAPSPAHAAHPPAYPAHSGFPAIPGYPTQPAYPAQPAHSSLEMQLSPKQRGFVRSMQAQVLGEVLIRLGTITREQLERALQVQRAASVHIGEALVETGAATWDQIRKGLEVQRQLRRAA
jgi:hypothetical protein